MKLKPFEMEEEENPQQLNTIKAMDNSEFKNLVSEKMLDNDLYADLLEEP